MLSSYCWQRLFPAEQSIFFKKKKRQQIHSSVAFLTLKSHYELNIHTEYKAAEPQSFYLLQQVHHWPLTHDVSCLHVWVCVCVFRVWSLSENRVQLSVRNSRDEQQLAPQPPCKGSVRHLEQEVRVKPQTHCRSEVFKVRVQRWFRKYQADKPFPFSHTHMYNTLCKKTRSNRFLILFLLPKIKNKNKTSHTRCFPNPYFWYWACKEQLFLKVCWIFL